MDRGFIFGYTPECRITAMSICYTQLSSCPGISLAGVIWSSHEDQPVLVPWKSKTPGYDEREASIFGRTEHSPTLFQPSLPLGLQGSSSQRCGGNLVPSQRYRVPFVGGLACPPPSHKMKSQGRNFESLSTAIIFNCGSTVCMPGQAG